MLGDYSHCHATLAQGLRTLGHNVTVGSDGTNWMQTPRDINLYRSNNKLGGMWLYYKTLFPLHRYLKGYDIVAINDPIFISLRPKRLKTIFDRLRKDNGAVFYTAMSTDINYLKMAEDSNGPLAYTEWFVNGTPTPWRTDVNSHWDRWHDKEIVDYENYIFDNIDGAIAVLYEYYEALKYRFPLDKIAYGGIPIDISLPDKYTRNESHPEIRFLLGYHHDHIKMKGAQFLEQAAKNIVEKYPEKASLKIVENLPYKSFLNELADSDVILDQIYSYSPSTTPLLAMAMGKTVVTGGENNFYNFIGEKENKPIVNAALTLPQLESQLEYIVNHPKELKVNADKNILFVKQHNDHIKVAQRFLDFWLNNLPK